MAQVEGRQPLRTEKDLGRSFTHGRREGPGRPAEEPRRLFSGIGQGEGILGGGESRGDAAHLLIQLVGPAGGQGDALGQQPPPFLLGQ